MLDIEIIEKSSLKNASGRIRGEIIEIRMPKHWPQKEKTKAVQSLVKRLMAQEAKLGHTKPFEDASAQTLTFHTKEELKAYVVDLNRQTYQAPLKDVRIGRSKYSHLAQVNLKTRVMTVSRYCLTRVPESAFRYLICHELAHFYEASHNRRFWSLVAQHVPDYKHQSKWIKAFHNQAVREADRLEGQSGSGSVKPIPQPIEPAEPPDETPDEMETDSILGRVGQFSRQLTFWPFSSSS